MTAEDDFDLYAFLVRAAWNDIHIEHARATAMWPPMRSPHEGLSILQEEVFELQQEVYKKPNKRDLFAMRTEAIQIAAMAWRFAIDCCEEERGRL